MKEQITSGSDTSSPETIIIDLGFQKEIERHEKKKEHDMEERRRAEEERQRAKEQRQKEIEEKKQQEQQEQEKIAEALTDHIFDALRSDDFWEGKESTTEVLIDKIQERLDNPNHTVWDEINRMIDAIGKKEGLSNEKTEEIKKLVDKEFVDHADDWDKNKYNTYSSGDKGQFTLDGVPIITYETDEYDVPANCTFLPDQFARKMNELVGK